jgi:hypothetical protein
MNAVKHVYKAVKKKVKQFEFDGFSITTILGFIPFPAPQFKRKRSKHRSKSKRVIVKLNASKDPVVDTMEKLRDDAIEDGDYVTAFGSALAQNVYQKNKKDNRQTTL